MMEANDSTTTRPFKLEAGASGRRNPADLASLIVLAGGMGRRFGGLKQLFPIGCKRQTILEYTLDDAQKLGIKHVIFVIRKEIEPEFREVVLNKLYRRPFEIKLVYQEFGPLPEGVSALSERVRPWGSAHALKVGFEALKTSNVVVVNADDYYGPHALKMAVEVAMKGSNAVIAYPVEKTISHHGPVNRTIIKTNGKTAVDIERLEGLHQENAPAGSLAAMNLMAFGSPIKEVIDKGWTEFCKSGGTQSMEEEFNLTGFLSYALKNGTPMEVIATTDQWMGLTYREDAMDVELKIGRVKN